MPEQAPLTNPGSRTGEDQMPGIQAVRSSPGRTLDDAMTQIDNLIIKGKEQEKVVAGLIDTAKETKGLVAFGFIILVVMVATMLIMVAFELIKSMGGNGTSLGILNQRIQYPESK